MFLLETLIISFGVSLDAFAVSAGGALCASRLPVWRKALRAALFFGSFQFLMPVAGFFVAGTMTDLLAACDHYVAFGLLAFVGGKMVFEGFAERKSGNGKGAACPREHREFFAIGNLFLPAIATSIDALAVGAGFAFARKPLWGPALSMGIVTGIVSACGVVLGSRAGRGKHAPWLTVAGGCAIIGIGLKILLTDLKLL